MPRIPPDSKQQACSDAEELTAEIIPGGKPRLQARGQQKALSALGSGQRFHKCVIPEGTKLFGESGRAQYITWDKTVEDTSPCTQPAVSSSRDEGEGAGLGEPAPGHTGGAEGLCAWELGMGKPELSTAGPKPSPATL